MSQIIDEPESNLLHPNYICDFCRQENASWLSASVHTDCANIADGVHVIPKAERYCACNCQYH